MKLVHVLPLFMLFVSSLSMAQIDESCRQQLQQIPAFATQLENVQTGLKEGYYTKEAAPILEEMIANQAKPLGLCGGMQEAEAALDMCQAPEEKLVESLNRIDKELEEGILNPESAGIARRMARRSYAIQMAACK